MGLSFIGCEGEGEALLELALSVAPIYHTLSARSLDGGSLIKHSNAFPRSIKGDYRRALCAPELVVTSDRASSAA
jgi:hypothetical protein